MRIERESWSRNSSNRDFLYEDGENTNAVVGLGGFLLAIGIFGTAIWGFIEILYHQGALDWKLETWQGYVASAGYLIMRSLNRVMYPKQ